MSGNLSHLPKFKDVRYSLKRHPSKRFPVLSMERKTTIAIHHSLTRQGLSGSNAEGFARFHVETHGWPGIGYNYIIEPDGTIKWCNDLELRNYHVGDHNNYAIGICLTGDFRYEEPTQAQKDSLRRLVYALQKEYNTLKYIKGHHEFSGYEWKQCQEFDYRSILNEKGAISPVTNIPNTYTVQEGDTFWSIAKGMKDLTVTDLEKANPDVDPTQLQIGQKINLGKAKGQAKRSEKQSSNYKGNSIVDYLNTIGEDASFSNREKLAKQYGVSGYKGTASQNIQLLNKMRDGISSSPKSTANLKVDGKWAELTTKALQEALGTIVDGIISNQLRNAVTEAFYGNTINFNNSRKGSTVIKALQRKIGAKADGLLGPATIRSLQSYLGTVRDGILSRPSLVVEEMQRRLNAGTF